MDFGSGLGLSFDANDEEQNFNNSETGESPNYSDQDDQMEDEGETSGEHPGENYSFQAQLEDMDNSEPPDDFRRPNSSNQGIFNNQTPSENYSFQAPLEDMDNLEPPDASPRPRSSNQVASNNQTPFRATLPSSSQPYRQAQPSVPFHLSADLGFQNQNQMNRNFESQPSTFNTQSSSGAQIFANNFAHQNNHNLQFGGNDQFTGHGHPQPGFQNLSTEYDLDGRNAFGNSGLQSQLDSQSHMSVQGMQQSSVRAAASNAFQMNNYSPLNNNQTFGGPQMGQHGFDQQNLTMNTFQPQLGSSMNSHLQSIASAPQQIGRNPYGNQFGVPMRNNNLASFARSGMNQMNNNPQLSSPYANNGSVLLSNLQTQSFEALQGHPSTNNPSLLPNPTNVLPSSVAGQQNNNRHIVNEWIITKMRELGMDPRDPHQLRIFKDKCMEHKRQLERQKQARENAEAAVGVGGSSRVSSASTLIHHPLDPNGGMNQGMGMGMGMGPEAGMGQGQLWSNQFGQGMTNFPFQPQGNAFLGSQMNNNTAQRSFPPVPAHLVLRSNNDPSKPVFGQHPRDYTQINTNNPINRTDPRPFVPYGSAGLITDPSILTSQQLRAQLQPPNLNPLPGRRNQPLQNQNQFINPNSLQMNRNGNDNGNGNPQFNQFGQAGPSQQLHHHNLSPEYTPLPHGPHPNNSADTDDDSAEPIEEDADEQQEEGSESQARQTEEIEEEESEHEEEQDEGETIVIKIGSGDSEEEREMGSDGLSVHSDHQGSPNPNVFARARPAHLPPSPPPRFPSNEVNPNNAPNRPPPIIGPGRRVYSQSQHAFNEKGHLVNWDHAARRRVEGNCQCGGFLHHNGRGFYARGGDGSRVWCNGGVVDGGVGVGGSGNEHVYGNENRQNIGGGGGDWDGDGDDEDDGSDDGDDSEDENLIGVPAWVKQVLTHGPRIDQEKVRKQEAAYRKMMAEKVRNLMARKAAQGSGEKITEANTPGDGPELFDFDAFLKDHMDFSGNDEERPETSSNSKGKRKARDSDEESEVQTPVKKWKGKGRAAESDDELDEAEVERKYRNQAKDKSREKPKDNFFTLPDTDTLLSGDSAETSRRAEGLGVAPGTEGHNDGNNDSIFGVGNPAHDPEVNAESADLDPELAACGVVLPESFPLEEEIEEIPRPAPYLSRRNEGPFNIYQSLLLTPEIILEFVRHLSPKQLLALYSISRPFNEILSGWIAHAIKSIVKYQAPFSYKIYPFVLYHELTIDDPLGNLNQSGTIRRVPSPKYHQMVLHRVRAVRDILAALARQHLRCPPGTKHSLKKVWFLMDISTTLDRVRLMHNREFFTDEDLYNIQHFIVKLDMRLNDPMDGPGSDFLRKLMLGQRGLSPLWRLLTRTGFTNMFEMHACIVRYTYAPLVVADDIQEGLFGVPFAELGRAHLEGWGKGDKHLMRIDELVMREATRRELGFREHIIMMFLWGFVDPVTGENTEAGGEECYMSDGEGEEREAEGDPWNGSGMNMAMLEAEVLGREDDDENEDGDENMGDWEDDWEDEEGFEMDGGAGSSNSAALWGR